MIEFDADTAHRYDEARGNRVIIVPTLTNVDDTPAIDEP